MPKSPDEATTKAVQYPDDLPGEKWTITEYLYWDASDEADREELPEDAKYGLWLPVRRAGTDAETWASCPRALRDWLIENDADEGDTFEVLAMKKGDAPHDPYAVDARMLNGEGEPQ
jgi:hypothetical protein